MKKIFALLLAITCLFASNAYAEKLTLTEDVPSYTWAEGWGTGLSAYTTDKGTEAYIAKGEGYSGDYAMVAANPNNSTDNTRIWSKLKGLEPGKKYTVSAMVKIKGKLPAKLGAVIRITETYLSGAGTAWGTSLNITETGDTWKELSAQFTVPDTFTSACICLDTSIIPGDALVYWDDVKASGGELKNGGFENVMQVEPENITVPEGADQIMKNGGFEEGNTGWNIYGGGWDNNPYSTLQSEVVYEGKNAVKISTQEAGKNPWVSQMLNVEPCNIYVLVCYVNIDTLDSKSTTQIKFEFYSEPRSAVETIVGAAFATQPIPHTNGKWVRFFQEFHTPANCRGVAVLPRLYGTGTVYYDNLSVYRVTEPLPFELMTDWTYYYSDKEVGNATIKSTGVIGDIAGYTAKIQLRKEDNVIYESDAFLFDGAEVTCKFPLLKLTEKQSKYIIEATVYDAEQTVADVLSDEIYRYDRPTCLREDGVYLKDGKPFYPVIAYHIGRDQYDICKAAGINVAQAHFTRMDEIDRMILQAEKSDFMLLVCLYRDGKSAAHPDNIEMTREVVEKYKDHPNVYAWALMDEPFAFIPFFDCIDELKEAYRVIRDIDSRHPVYTLDNYKETFPYSAKFVDILATDPYPASGYEFTTYVASQMRYAQEAVKYEKPVCAIVQAFEYQGSWPTGNQARSMIYQALFEGSKAVGYFSVGDSRKDAEKNNITLYDTDLWEPLKGLTTDFSMAFDVFTNNVLPTFSEKRGEDCWYRSWVKDNKLYMAVLNRSDKNSTTVSIPLTSFDGKIKLDAYTAKIIAGGSMTKSGNGALEITLDPAAAQLWEITPSDTIDFAGLPYCQYSDLYNYAWARGEAEYLKSQDITGKAAEYMFRPADAITRGEFAYYLVRTLNIAGAETDNFADINDLDYYKKELAIGKGAGILNGIGENKFNPYAKITRQDMMTMLGRALKLENTNTDFKGNFSDSGIIANYAIPFVSAMIEHGIIKGNADGTLNPLGNTTKAETAVIMHRIMQK